MLFMLTVRLPGSDDTIAAVDPAIWDDLPWDDRGASDRLMMSGRISTP